MNSKIIMTITPIKTSDTQRAAICEEGGKHGRRGRNGEQVTHCVSRLADIGVCLEK